MSACCPSLSSYCVGRKRSEDLHTCRRPSPSTLLWRRCATWSAHFPVARCDAHPRKVGQRAYHVPTRTAQQPCTYQLSYPVPTNLTTLYRSLAIHSATHFHVHNLRQPATRLESPFPNPVSKCGDICYARSSGIAKGMARDAMGALWAPVLTVPLSSQASHKPSVRANKLTHLLVGSVGGTSSTVFIATVCSDEHARQRTHKTLEIAARAANVRGQPVVRQCWTQLRQGQAQVGRGGGVGYGVPS